MATITSPESAQPSSKALTILVIGGSGMIGSRITEEAASRGRQVVVAARHPEKIKSGANVRAVRLDATDKAALITLAKCVEVIVSATSPRGGGDPILEAKGIGEAVIAAGTATGKRVFVVGGAGSLKKDNGTYVADDLKGTPYLGEALGMRGVLELLKASGTNWTYFSRALSIAPGQRSGNYRLGTDTVLRNDRGESNVSAEDFAMAVLDEPVMVVVNVSLAALSLDLHGRVMDSQATNDGIDLRHELPLRLQRNIHDDIGRENIFSGSERPHVEIVDRPFAEGKNGLFDIQILEGIADEHSKTIGQVVLRWVIQRGVVVLAKSVKKQRMAENIAVFDFDLDADDIATLETCSSQFFSHRDPGIVKWMSERRLNI